MPGLASVLLPLGLAVLLSGIWTGNLVFSAKPVVIPPQQLIAARRERAGRSWYRWIGAALVLVALGFAALVIGDQTLEPGVDDNSLAGTAVWALWLLSWTAAGVTACMGVALGVLHAVTRHHTRSA